MEVNKIVGEEITLEVVGRLNTTTSSDFQTQLLASFEEGKNIILDLEKLEYISSAGLRTLLVGEKTAKSKGLKFSIVNANEDTMHIFVMTGFADILSVN